MLCQLSHFNIICFRYLAALAPEPDAAAVCCSYRLRLVSNRSCTRHRCSSAAGARAAVAFGLTRRLSRRAHHEDVHRLRPPAAPLRRLPCSSFCFRSYRVDGRDCCSGRGRRCVGCSCKRLRHRVRVDASQCRVVLPHRCQSFCFASCVLIFQLLIAAAPAVCLALAAIASIPNRKPELSQSARGVQVPNFTCSTRAFLISSLQARATRCCSALAAALKTIVANKAQWSLPDGEWGEYLACAAAIDADAVDEVCCDPSLWAMLIFSDAHTCTLGGFDSTFWSQGFRRNARLAAGASLLRMYFSVPNLTLVGSDGHPQSRPTNYEAAPFAQYKTRQYGCVLAPSSMKLRDRGAHSRKMSTIELP